MKELVIKKVTDFIKEQGLEVADVREGGDGFITVQTKTSNIRRIGMKSFMEFIGNRDHTIGYDQVTFHPSADLYSFSYQAVSEDPHVKSEDVKENLHDVLGKYVEKEEIEVIQDDTANLDDAALFNFTVTSSAHNGLMAEAAYLNYATPSHKAKSKELLTQFVQDLQKQPVAPDFNPEVNRVDTADVVEAVLLDEEDYRNLSKDELNAVEEKLKQAKAAAQIINQPALDCKIDEGLDLIRKIRSDSQE